MKARSFKKFFVSIALSAVLTLSSASSVFAATAQLAPAEQSVEQAQSDDSDTPAIESSDAQNACASLTAQPGIRQTAASENSVTIQWNPVTFQICCQYQPFKFLFLSFSRLYWQYPQQS